MQAPSNRDLSHADIFFLSKFFDPMNASVVKISTPVWKFKYLLRMSGVPEASEYLPMKLEMFREE
jgi:hypothetical protein